MRSGVAASSWVQAWLANWRLRFAALVSARYSASAPVLVVMGFMLSFWVDWRHLSNFSEAGHVQWLAVAGLDALPDEALVAFHAAGPLICGR